jgi:hypothetical protein
MVCFAHTPITGALRQHRRQTTSIAPISKRGSAKWALQGPRATPRPAAVLPDSRFDSTSNYHAKNHGKNYDKIVLTPASGIGKKLPKSQPVLPKASLTFRMYTFTREANLAAVYRSSRKISGFISAIANNKIRSKS